MKDPSVSDTPSHNSRFPANRPEFVGRILVVLEEMLILLPLPPRNRPHHHRHCAGRRRTRASPSAEPETGTGTPCAPTD